MKHAKAGTLQKERDTKQMRIYLLSILVFTFLLYGNSLRNEYAFDDNYVTVTTPDHPNNPRVAKGFAGIPEILTTHYIESQNQSFEYRPLVLITYAIEYQFFGSNPHVSHFINVLLYALTGMLLFLVLLSFLSTYSMAFCALITFLFLAHPIHTEVVDNLKSRDELLSFLLGLSSVYFCFKAYGKKKWKYLIGAVVSLFLALLAKKTAILFAALIPVALYYFSEIKLKAMLPIVMGVLLVYIIHKLIPAWFLSDTKVQREYTFFENPLFYEHHVSKRIPFMFYTMGFYLRLMVVPYPLVCYYGYDTVPLTGWVSPVVWISALCYLALFIMVFRDFGKKSLFSFGLLIYLMGVIPFANLAPPVVGIVGERYLYFSSLGFCIVLGYLLSVVSKTDVHSAKSWSKAFSPMLKKALVLILMIFSITTISRNSKWKDVITLYRNDVKAKENSYMLQYFTASTIYEQAQLANLSERNKMMAEAQEHFIRSAQLLERGLQEFPTDYHSMSALGTIYVNYLNNVQAAIPWFQRSLALKPDNDVCRYNLVFCYEKRNMTDSALVLYEGMVKKGTTYPPVYFRLHDLYLKRQAYKKAIELDSLGVTKNPDEVKIYVNLGSAYMMNKDTLKGLNAYEAAANKAPGDQQLLYNVARVFSLVGNLQKAQQYQKKADFLKERAARP